MEGRHGRTRKRALEDRPLGGRRHHRCPRRARIRPRGDRRNSDRGVKPLYLADDPRSKLGLKPDPIVIFGGGAALAVAIWLGCAYQRRIFAEQCAMATCASIAAKDRHRFPSSAVNTPTATPPRP